jgi:hypothetical protein
MVQAVDCWRANRFAGGSPGRSATVSITSWVISLIAFMIVKPVSVCMRACPGWRRGERFLSY